MNLIIKNPSWNPNGTKNIQGNLFEEVTFSCDISLYEYKSIREPHFQSNLDTTDGFAYWTLEGSNFDESFDVGDEVIGIGDSASIKGIVTSVSSDVLGIDRNDSLTTATGTDSGVLNIFNLSDLEYIKVKYGLSDLEEYQSLLDGETNSYIFEDVGLVESTGIPTTKNASSGDMKLTFIERETSPVLNNGANLTAQLFSFEHTFLIQNYNESLKLALQDGEKTDEYLGDNTLNYFLEIDARQKEDRSSKLGYYESSGNIGYIKEAFNGGSNPFNLDSVTFTDTLDSSVLDKLSNVRQTSVSALISGTFFDNNVDIYHLTLLNEEDYQFKNEYFKDLFRFKDTSNVTNLTVTTISPTQKRYDFDLDISDSDINDYDYILGLHLNVSATKRVNIPISIATYSSSFDVPDLFEFTRIEQLCHSNDFVDSATTEGFENAFTTIEETVLTFGEFWLDESKKAELVSLDFTLSAINTVTNNKIDFRTYKFDFDSTKIGDNQQISLNTTRGYNLKEGSQFNDVKIVTTNKVGDKQYYEVLIPWKVPYQSWLSFADADTQIYDVNEPHNGLNQDASRSFFGDYEFRTYFDAVVSNQEQETNYQSSGGRINVYGDDEDETGLQSYECEIQTYNIDGTVINNNLIKDNYTEIRARLTPPTPPNFSTTFDFTAVANTWNRFAHGDYFDAGVVVVRGGEWLNNQVDDDDYFINPSIPSFPQYTKDTVSYTSTTSSITSVNNLSAFYGLYSLEKYNNFSISGDMYSLDVDNDVVSLIIAFNVDEFGIESTLSLCATTGGFEFIPPSGYIGLDTENIFNQVTNEPCKYALVYNFGKADSKILDFVDTTSALNLGWGDVGDLVFDVSKEINNINASVSWQIDGTTFNTPLSFDLSSDVDTQKFIGFNYLGFGFMSQNNGGFKNVVLNVPTYDFYGKLYIEPEDSNSENSFMLSTLREASDFNLLKQKGIDLKKATIEYVNGDFIITGLVETSLINLDIKYRLSVQIAPINNEL